MYDRNQPGQAEPSYASSLSNSLASGPAPLAALPRPSHASSLPASHRSAPVQMTLGVADGGLFSARGPLRTRMTTLAGLFQLPTTLQGYLVFTFCLLILAFTMVLHVTLSAEIMRLEERLIALQSDYTATEHKNAGLIYEIGRYSSLQEINRTALLAGYVPASETRYVVERPDVVESLNNPAPAVQAPEYLILGDDAADTVGPVAPLTAPITAPTELTEAETAAESSFWSNFRWERVRGALAETGLWLRDRMPSWNGR